MTTKSPVLEAIESVNSAFEDFKKSNDERLDAFQARIEQAEALKDRLKGTDASGARVLRPYREIVTASGEKAFEVGAKQRFSDVPELAGKSEVSLARVLGALALGKNCGDPEALEYANEMKATSTGTSGITLQNTVASEWIDMVRAQAVTFQAGARSISMPTQQFAYIHQTSDPTATWRSSEGASLSATDPGFAARVLTAKTLAVRTQLSLEASQDIADAGSQLARVQAGAMAAAIDAAVFTGSTPAPTGIHNMSGVGKVTGVGTPTNWDEVLDGVGAFLNANNALSDLSGIVMHPNIWKTYAKLKTGITSDNTPLELPPAIASVPQFVSTGADIVASPEDYHITLGNFGDLLVGFRMDPSVRILDNTTSYAGNLLIEIVGVARVDVVALRPASFVVLEGVTS
jgi:HK97 family phage major capsid protein